MLQNKEPWFSQEELDRIEALEAIELWKPRLELIRANPRINREVIMEE